MADRIPLDVYERQIEEMRAVGLDSDVWIIGTGPIDHWGPVRIRHALGNFAFECQDRLQRWPPKDAGHPMTYRWARR